MKNIIYHIILLLNIIYGCKGQTNVNNSSEVNIRMSNDEICYSYGVDQRKVFNYYISNNSLNTVSISGVDYFVLNTNSKLFLDELYENHQKKLIGNGIVEEKEETYPKMKSRILTTKVNIKDYLCLGVLRPNLGTCGSIDLSFYFENDGYKLPLGDYIFYIISAYNLDGKVSMLSDSVCFKVVANTFKSNLKDKRIEDYESSKFFDQRWLKGKIESLSNTDIMSDSLLYYISRIENIPEYEYYIIKRSIAVISTKDKVTGIVDLDLIRIFLTYLKVNCKNYPKILSYMKYNVENAYSVGRPYYDLKNKNDILKLLNEFN